ncbi:MAG: hypothetical protein ABSD03_17930 [Vulcanimicrobiaceae bacterium]|jgi:hypothetical protein
MRVGRLLLAAAFAVVLSAGCASGSGGSSASASPQPAPTNPDLGAVLENFYQQIEDEHWSFAYAMLSARYRARLSQGAFVDRYRDIADLNVTVLQDTGRVVQVTLDGHRAGDPAKHVASVEWVRLAWDGQEWTIDDIRRARAQSRESGR